MLETALLQCLSIDLTRAPLALRVAISFQADEIRDLSCPAGGQQVPLLVVCTPASVTLISNTEHQVQAFRPVLESVHQRVQTIEGWRSLTVRSGIGSNAGRLLLRQAIPRSRFESELQDFVCAVRSAAKLSADCGAFSTELGDLVRSAEHAAERLWHETILGRAAASDAEIEIETLAAERIIEEELLAWQSSAPSLRASRRAFADSGIGPFGAQERHSMVQLRSGGALTRPRSA